MTSGKGRYAGAKGDGTYEVTQNQPATAAGETIGAVDIVLNIKK